MWVCACFLLFTHTNFTRNLKKISGKEAKEPPLQSSPAPWPTFYLVLSRHFAVPIFYSASQCILLGGLFVHLKYLSSFSLLICQVVVVCYSFYKIKLSQSLSFSAALNFSISQFFLRAVWAVLTDFRIIHFPTCYHVKLLPNSNGFVLTKVMKKIFLATLNCYTNSLWKNNPENIIISFNF